MGKNLLRRYYEIGWYAISEEDAKKGVISSLSKRGGVQNIRIGSCFLTQLKGDMGYKICVSYEEDLDKTFGFPENLEKVIFLDTDGSILPYGVQSLALETNAGIVLTTPSLKDEFYDEGSIIPMEMADLMEDASKNGVQIVGITPSISRWKRHRMASSEMVKESINEYLVNHPSIKNFIVINRENIPDLPNLIQGDTINLINEDKARDMLNEEKNYNFS